ncbi:hypothetical protein OAS17_02295 [Methylophilaceae bacterium]|nr:hypothetical protein [Methylophilaceae bacterium]
MFNIEHLYCKLKNEDKQGGNCRHESRSTDNRFELVGSADQATWRGTRHRAFA